MFTSKMTCAAVSLCCLVGQILGASSDWAVVQGLAAGERIQLDLTTGKILKGRIDHVTADAVYLQTQSQTAAVSRDEISRLYVTKKRNWAKPVLIGAAAGAAAAGIAAPRFLEHESGYAGAVAGTVVLGAVVGAGVGCIARGSGKLLIYESPRGR